jgi:hypothetical protein
MKPQQIFATALLIILAIVFSQCSEKQSTGISEYLPADSDLEGWAPSDTARTFVGEDLFLLINGGAEKYHEFGFRQVVTQRYDGPNDKQVSVEVFEMQDAVAADKIYAYKTSADGEPLPIGSEARLEDYYLNFKKGRFLVTLVGFDSESDTRDGLIAIARAVEQRLPEE